MKRFIWAFVAIGALVLGSTFATPALAQHGHHHNGGGHHYNGGGNYGYNGGGVVGYRGGFGNSGYYGGYNSYRIVPTYPSAGRYGFVGTNYRPAYYGPYYGGYGGYPAYGNGIGIYTPSIGVRVGF
jgi:hypothetical protein